MRAGEAPLNHSYKLSSSPVTYQADRGKKKNPQPEDKLHSDHSQAGIPIPPAWMKAQGTFKVDWDKWTELCFNQDTGIN